MTPRRHDEEELSMQYGERVRDPAGIWGSPERETPPDLQKRKESAMDSRGHDWTTPTTTPTTTTPRQDSTGS